MYICWYYSLSSSHPTFHLLCLTPFLSWCWISSLMSLDRKHSRRLQGGIRKGTKCPCHLLRRRQACGLVSGLPEEGSRKQLSLEGASVRGRNWSSRRRAHREELYNSALTEMRADKAFFSFFPQIQTFNSNLTWPLAISILIFFSLDLFYFLLKYSWFTVLF